MRERSADQRELVSVDAEQRIAPEIDAIDVCGEGRRGNRRAKAQPPVASRERQGDARSGRRGQARSGAARQGVMAERPAPACPVRHPGRGVPCRDPSDRRRRLVRRNIFPPKHLRSGRAGVRKDDRHACDELRSAEASIRARGRGDIRNPWIEYAFASTFDTRHIFMADDRDIGGRESALQAKIRHDMVRCGIIT